MIGTRPRGRSLCGAASQKRSPEIRMMVFGVGFHDTPPDVGNSVHVRHQSFLQCP
jgi:hypothetical protein